METLSKIAQLSAEVNALARAYIIEPQAALREKIISCHLLISEIAYKGDPELDAARESTGQEAFKPVLPDAPIRAVYNPDLNTDVPPKGHFTLKLMRYYYGGPNLGWVERLSQSVGFPSIDAAKEFADKEIPGTPGYEVVSYEDEMRHESQVQARLEDEARQKEIAEDSKESTQAP